jgi:hypothetical protein
MNDRPIRRRRPPLPPSLDTGFDQSDDTLRQLDPDETAQYFPRREPTYDYAGLASQLEAGKAYSIKVPPGHRPRTFYLHLLRTARDQFSLRLHLAKGTGGARLDASGLLLFRADAIQMENT